tara:strand:- start:1890 stop:2576 length:687 start_codon:yes stop_codon:yes gene_type:complete
MGKLIVSHQPQYFPQLELYNKILQSNKFIYLDEVKFKNKAWHAKTIIKNSRDKIIKLIIPCLKNLDSKNIKDIKIAQHKWKFKHLKTIEVIYKKTKYFSETYEIIHYILSQKSDFLIDYTVPSITMFLEKLGYSKKNIFLQSKEEEIEGTKNDFLINLTKKFNGDQYLSGQGGKNYINEAKFLENNIIHKFNNFEHPKYLQSGQDFITKLSIIDAAFNIGIKELKVLI